MTGSAYDAFLLVSFGGPEQPEDVLPFLENVLRGRNVPRARMLEVAEHYYHFGGRSPLNDQNRALLAALEREFATHGPRLKLYLGNRNWRPFLADTVQQMAADGVRHALAVVTAAFGSYSGCRQYQEDLAAARAAAGAAAPAITKAPPFYNQPGFVTAVADHAREALQQIPEPRRGPAALFFTAHSIPMAMAAASPYVRQLEEACALVAKRLGRTEYRLVYQSRSGPPSQPWLGPDVLEAIRGSAMRDLALVPIGFISDHMEVVFDLDTQARELCEQRGVHMVRAATPGVHPAFVRMLRDLAANGAALECAADCCRVPGGAHAPPLAP
jgi:ferrochelatase